MSGGPKDGPLHQRGCQRRASEQSRVASRQLIVWPPRSSRDSIFLESVLAPDAAEGRGELRNLWHVWLAFPTPWGQGKFHPSVSHLPVPGVPGTQGTKTQIFNRLSRRPQALPQERKHRPSRVRRKWADTCFLPLKMTSHPLLLSHLPGPI